MEQILYIRKCLESHCLFMKCFFDLWKYDTGPLTTANARADSAPALDKRHGHRVVKYRARHHTIRAVRVVEHAPARFYLTTRVKVKPRVRVITKCAAEILKPDPRQ